MSRETRNKVNMVWTICHPSGSGSCHGLPPGLDDRSFFYDQ